MARIESSVEDSGDDRDGRSESPDLEAALKAQLKDVQDRLKAERDAKKQRAHLKKMADKKKESEEKLRRLEAQRTASARATRSRASLLSPVRVEFGGGTSSVSFGYVAHALGSRRPTRGSARRERLSAMGRTLRGLRSEFMRLYFIPLLTPLSML